MTQHANVVGVGLIGGSLALSLVNRGWSVSVSDRDPNRVEDALSRGLATRSGLDADAEITFVATPVGAVTRAVRDVLDRTTGIVTDVGSVKQSIVEAFDDPRFLGGHPMAGSEQDGLDGADADMFQGAAWVLTPSEATSDTTFSFVSSVVRELGADVITMEAVRHDEMVAMVSHVPHLAAATLMGLANERAVDHGALLRVAAGGFRDMTRIAAGSPGIWPDICTENGRAISATLTRLIDALSTMRSLVDEGDVDRLVGSLEAAREARVNLPSSAPAPDDLVEIRVPVLDRRGEVAAVASLATELSVNLYDIEIAHSTEGERGVITLVVDRALAPTLADGLRGSGYRPSTRDL